MKSKNKYDVYTWIKRVMDSAKNSQQLSVADKLVDLFKESLYYNEFFYFSETNGRKIDKADVLMIMDLKSHLTSKEQSFGINPEL